MQLTITAIENFPIIYPGDNLPNLIVEKVEEQGMTVLEGDIFVITQKIVSKAENCFVNLAKVHPSTEAIALAEQTQKDARIVELILRESKSVLRARPGLLIVEHRLGFVCANAGIDHSNVQSLDGTDEWVLLLPDDPEGSATIIRKALEEHFHARLGLMITDSFGRAWRNGVTGVAIGLSGLPALIDKRGQKDIFDHTLQSTQIATADELAAAASLVMGESNEKLPIVLVRGFPYDLKESTIRELIREQRFDLFR